MSDNEDIPQIQQQVQMAQVSSKDFAAKYK
jgi:hypothetical protein